MVCLKEFIVVLGVLVFFTATCYAAVYNQPAASHPDYPGKCFDRISKRAMLPGKEYKAKGICAVMTCDIDHSMIQIETCPYIEMPGCVELPADPKRSYPKCCPQFLCTNEKGEELLIDATTL